MESNPTYYIATWDKRPFGGVVYIYFGTLAEIREEAKETSWYDGTLGYACWFSCLYDVLKHENDQLIMPNCDTCLSAKYHGWAIVCSDRQKKSKKLVKRLANNAIMNDDNIPEDRKDFTYLS